MEHYRISRVPGTGPLSLEDCRKLPSLTLKQAFEGRGAPVPTTTAVLAARDDALLVFMQTAETPPKAVCAAVNGKVHLDSCMEFFVTFDQKAGPEYLNFEINPIGCLHLAFGPDRYTRKPAAGDDARQVFNIHTGIQPDGWWVRYEIPYTFVKEYFPGFTNMEEADLAANFYKCGDETDAPHWGCWNPIVVEKPDFHRPDFFGRLSL